jgi:putative transposase
VVSTAAAPTDETGVSEAGASVDQPASAQVSDAALTTQIRTLINQFPTYGYRRITALLRRKGGLQVNHKRVYRLLRQQGWMVTQRSKTPKPRVRGSRSQTEASNVRWAIDISHGYCGADGWGHLVAVIDCHDREIVGWEFARRGPRPGG